MVARLQWDAMLLRASLIVSQHAEQDAGCEVRGREHCSAWGERRRQLGGCERESGAWSTPEPTAHALTPTL